MNDLEIRQLVTRTAVVFVTGLPSTNAPVQRVAQQSSAGPNFFDSGDGSSSPNNNGGNNNNNGGSSATAGSSGSKQTGVAIGAPLRGSNTAGPSSTAMAPHLNNTPPAGATATADAPDTMSAAPNSQGQPMLVNPTAGISRQPSSVAAQPTAAATIASVDPNAAASSSNNNVSPAQPSSTNFSGSSGFTGSGSGSSTTPSASATAAADSAGMSGGAKAGLAFGIIALIALLIGGAFLFYRKQKQRNEAHRQLEDEKIGGYRDNPSPTFNSAPMSNMNAQQNPNAPRLSLRPVNDMFPDMANRSGATTPRSGPNPFDDANAVTGAEAGAAAGAVAAGATPLAQKRQSPPAGAANVHRVQMDFAPSMEDELELKAGQLVRMLHEYDDGWALCKRLDKSQQGVVPRTCLSRLPVKPRPAGAPQGQRGPGNNGPRQGPPPQQRQGPPRP